jgi:hypothetical protein
MPNEAKSRNKCSQLEIMHGRMDQMERNHQQPNTPANNQGASRNLTSDTVNQVPDLNEPASDPIWEQHGHSRSKRNQVVDPVIFFCYVLFFYIHKWSFL